MMASPGSAIRAFGTRRRRVQTRATIETWEFAGAFLEHQAAQARTVIVEQRPHRTRDQDGVVGQLLARGRLL